MCEGFLYLFSYFNLGCLSVPVSVCLSLLWTAVKKKQTKKTLRRVCSAINCLVPTNSKTAGAAMNTSDVSISRRQTH